MGVLICNVGAATRASGQDANSDGAQLSDQNRNMRCTLRNRRTGTSNVYRGTLLLSKSINAPSLDPTLLWNVVVDQATTPKTLLDQSFSLDTDSAKKPLRIVDRRAEARKVKRRGYEKRSFGSEADARTCRNVT